MNLEIPRVRGSDACTKISPIRGIRNFWAAAIGIKRDTVGRRLAQNDTRNAKVSTKSHFRPRIDLTSQYFFAISKVQISKTMPKSTSVASWLPLELNAPRTMDFMIF